MKIALFLMFLLVTVVQANGLAQRVSLSASSMKIEDFFSEVSRQTNHRFFYSSEVARTAGKVRVELRNVSVEEALRRVLDQNKFEFKVIAGTVTINLKEDIKEANPLKTQQQDAVKGYVKDLSGKPLSGATISVKGTNRLAVSAPDGSFSIVASPTATLVIVYVGHQTVEVPVQNRTNINIILEEVLSEIDAVDVVATGYQNIDRKLFTGASTRIDAKDAERAGVPDISRMLEGQAAGVSVQNVSGTFGAAPKIRVRGATSLSGDNKPLWVVDGIILEDVVNISNEALSTGDVNTLIGSSVAGLNPDDIESFNILKDAAATAMYGARAMNGVIVVTTKKGRNTDGKANVNYSGTYTTYLKPNYSQFDIMNSAEQMSILLEQENKYYFDHSSVSRVKDGGIFYKMYNLMYQYDETSGQFGLANTLDARLGFLERYAKSNTDWFDVLFRNSLLQEHSLSITNGTPRAQSYFSSSFTGDSGQSLGDNVKRYTANFRNNLKISDKLSAEVLVNGSIRDQRAPGTLTRRSDAVYGQYSRDFDINPYSYALNTSRLITPYDENGNFEYFNRNYASFNILNELENNYLKLGMIDLKVQGGLRYKVLSPLTYSVDAAYRYARTERQHHVLENSNMVLAHQANFDSYINENNDFLYADPDNPGYPAVVVLPEGGFYNTDLDNLVNYYFRQNLEYDTNIGSDHRLNAFASMELRYTDRQSTAYQGIGYQYENGGLVNPNYRYFKKMIEAGDPYFRNGYTYDRFLAYMFRAAYAYQDRYSVNFTTRYDGSNKLGSSRVARWLPTWNVSGKWNIDQESFFGSNPYLTALSIRGTYGLTASMGNATNSSAIFYNQVARRPYEDEKEAIIYLSSLENSELTWEKMYEFNIGTDITLFDQVNLTADYYKRNQFDLIGSIRTSGIGGQFTKVANYADMKAYGFEFTISGNPIKRPEGLTWRTNFNFSINKNEITNLEVNPNIWTLVRAEGGTVEGYAQRGLFSVQFDGLNPEYGYPTYIGTTGEKDTYINLQSQDIDYLRYHGPVDATFTGGFYNAFSFKNLELTSLFTFSAGNYVRLQPDYNADYNDMRAVSKDLVNRWLMPGDEQYTTIPALLDTYVRNNGVLRANGATVSAVYPYNAYNYSDQRVAHGDFIRLKQLSLGYLLPSRIVSRLRLNTAKISLVGNNIALLYADRKLNGADPEFFNNGGVAMPVPRQYTLSLKLGF
ncbi:SusC/RagA family TonB-linked outer membrane protein [Sphingobacterium alkalisoli]|nr:SusC/RagA family TonB-linked outer membrane protein [Sphingobacterium alkalisoli]